MSVTSVFALRYKDGILIACDTQVRLSRYPNCGQVERPIIIGDHTVIIGSGKHADLQSAGDKLYQEFWEDFVQSDGSEHGPAELSRCLSRLAYQQRRKIDPYWASFVIAGREKNGQLFLSSVNQYGLELTKEGYAATSYGHYNAMPYFRKHWREDLTEDEAKQLLHKVIVAGTDWMAASGYHWQITKITADGIKMERPERVDGNWYSYTLRQYVDEPICGMSY